MWPQRSHPPCDVADGYGRDGQLNLSNKVIIFIAHSKYKCSEIEELITRFVS